MPIVARINQKLRREISFRGNWKRVAKISKLMLQRRKENTNPILFFNASTRLEGLSLNAAFSLITSWIIQYEGIPVIHFVCHRGMSRCVLGTNNQDIKSPPPCDKCIATSKNIFANQEIKWAQYPNHPLIDGDLHQYSLKELFQFKRNDIPLGKFILPSMRWILRKHNLEDLDSNRHLAREYIKSAMSIYTSFNSLISQINPRAVIVFNGMFFPEALARYAAQKRQIPVYTHEVGMLPRSAFFTSGEATAYPVEIDNDFFLDKDQTQRLDNYLAKRFEGDFSTAGIRFWPEMRKPDNNLLEKKKSFSQVVAVFTNVVFDTSQSHANVIFSDMFSWLDLILSEIQKNPGTLFIIRAHPDEMRPNKESQETVAAWACRNDIKSIPNVIFIEPQEYLSSYEIIKKAKFIMVYNSTIGLEASIMGVPVLCAGRARYTRIPTVVFPRTISSFKKKLQEFLNLEVINQPKEYQIKAKRVLYSQLFRASLPFDDFVEEDEYWNGFVKIKDYPLERLSKSYSQTAQVLLKGILEKEPFILKQ